MIRRRAFNREIHSASWLYAHVVDEDYVSPGFSSFRHWLISGILSYAESDFFGKNAHANKSKLSTPGESRPCLKNY